ncbi:hypothetical protein SAMN02745751_03176 [Dethiosulfatibacter aminovorans DSM 17477]|uniref:Uncharacterized protein n=1 Tax=Dethiosulfatibacter aminovorans DSM 17477 TaxID=1121476 RepID=A0A1M6LHI8_9FIRM|nr:hypothetical protein [Dethiosulfatibacter aminovorans]SHJ70618.1 hypothetical protein SAMN02745751_03176 [Dethiosulfatibacter aminovorans DSM 17477]
MVLISVGVSLLIILIIYHFNEKRNRDKDLSLLKGYLGFLVCTGVYAFILPGNQIEGSRIVMLVITGVFVASYIMAPSKLTSIIIVLWLLLDGAFRGLVLYGAYINSASVDFFFSYLIQAVLSLFVLCHSLILSMRLNRREKSKKALKSNDVSNNEL